LGKAPEQKRPKATEVCFSAHRRELEAVYARRFAQDLVEFREIFGLGRCHRACEGDPAQPPLDMAISFAITLGAGYLFSLLPTRGRWAGVIGVCAVGALTPLVAIVGWLLK
jgi:hypothetical protein